jgi:hypothetical protein
MKAGKIQCAASLLLWLALLEIAQCLVQHLKDKEDPFRRMSFMVEGMDNRTTNDKFLLFELPSTRYSLGLTIRLCMYTEAQLFQPL